MVKKYTREEAIALVQAHLTHLMSSPGFADACNLLASHAEHNDTIEMIVAGGEIALKRKGSAALNPPHFVQIMLFAGKDEKSLERLKVLYEAPDKPEPRQVRQAH